MNVRGNGQSRRKERRGKGDERERERGREATSGSRSTERDRDSVKRWRGIGRWWGREEGVVGVEKARAVCHSNSSGNYYRLTKDGERATPPCMRAYIWAHTAIYKYTQRRLYSTLEDTVAATRHVTDA